MKIFCMSDIHGCINEFENALSIIIDEFEKADAMLLLLGDYVHGGTDSKTVLDKIMNLQNKYGTEKIVALCGNHEDRVLAGLASLDNYNANYDNEKVDAKYTSWISTLPYYYETEKTFFVHAGIDEEYGEYWKYTTTESILLHKYPAQVGEIKGFNKKIVAGHIYTSEIADDPNFNDIYFDGKSHYYIDGNVLKTHNIPILLVDTDTDRYYTVKASGKHIVFPY